MLAPMVIQIAVTAFPFCQEETSPSRADQAEGLATSLVPRVRRALMGKPPRSSQKDRDQIALGFYITAKGCPQEKVRQDTRPARSSGRRSARRRISHVALETDDEIQVLDIWESREAFEAFGRPCSDPHRSRDRDERVDGASAATKMRSKAQTGPSVARSSAHE